ncbi:hypothetical protein ACIPUC_33145 [Streptomyces sp. LARHCF249]
MKKRPVILLSLALLLFTAGAAGLSITQSGDENDRKIVNADIVGIWVGSKGGKFEIREDGKAALNGIKQNPSCFPPEDAKSQELATGEGVWEFARYPDESPGVRIDYRVPNPQSPVCNIWAVWVGGDPSGEIHLLHDVARGERFSRPSNAR